MKKSKTTAVVIISARFRPRRSENQPPVVAPTNIPINVADTMKLTVEIDMFQSFMTAGAANENVLIPPSSAKNMKPSSHMMRRWNEAIGRRSRRAAAVHREGCDAFIVVPRVPVYNLFILSPRPIVLITLGRALNRLISADQRHPSRGRGRKQRKRLNPQASRASAVHAHCGVLGR